LDGLTDEVTSNPGIKIVDTVRFFKGDKPAAEFEASRKWLWLVTLVEYQER